MADLDKNMMLVAEKKQKNNYQPNIVTESRQMFSSQEKNIVVSVVNQLTIRHFDQTINLFPNQDIDFLIPYSDLSKSRNYAEIERAAKSLQVKQQGFAFTNEKGERYWKYIIPFPQIENIMDKGKMHLKITMFSRAVPYYTELGRQWTSYNCEVMKSLPSQYAKRMYELLMRHFRTDDFTYVVDHLRQMMDVPEKYQYNDFTKRCLDVANQEICEAIGAGFTYEPIAKIGKRIIKLRFVKTSPENQAKVEVESNREYINNMPYGEAVAMACQWFSRYTLTNAQRSAITNDSERLADFLRIHSELHSGMRPDVRNITAYMVSSLGVANVKDKTKNVPKTSTPRQTSAPKTLGSIMGTLNLFGQSDDNK